MTFLAQPDAWDRSATLWLNSLYTPGADGFWAFLSHTQAWYPLYALVMVLLVVRLGWKRGLAAILACILTVVLADQTCNLVKAAVGRLRPCHDPQMLALGLHVPHPSRGLYGFFSAHATNTFSFALLTSRFLRPSAPSGTASPGDILCRLYTPVIFVWAVLVSLSRIVRGVHYLGDVLSGALFGLLLAALLLLLFRLIFNFPAAPEVREGAE